MEERERKLASIQKIIDIQPIEGADAIEVATILGWHVVVKKGEFHVGDLCVYIEIDSILPPREEFSFLEKNKYRIKTVRLRGQISQGIAFPVHLFKDDFEGTKIEEDLDVTVPLDVTKYEMPIPTQLAGKVRGNFPGFIPKTDEPRLQAFPRILEKYHDVEFYITEKVDGSSTTFYIRDDEFHVCSRNLDLVDDGGNSIWQVAKQMQIEEKMRAAGITEVALQGEIIGEGIQGNKLGIKGKTILFFNAYNWAESRNLNFKEFKELFVKLDLPTVPVAEKTSVLAPTVDQMVEFATIKSALNPDVWVEGLVWRSVEEMKDPKMGRLSFKVINPEFLLKNKE